MSQTWSEKETLALGISLYRNIYTKEMDVVSKLTNILDGNSDKYKWQQAFVGDKKQVLDYRDCNDFKFEKNNIKSNDIESETIKQVWQDCYDQMLPAVNDYINEYNMNQLQYWEIMNFIKYNPGQHFKTHCDHGFTYNSTTSLVGYLNDDYEGGELYFPLQNLKIKPKAGDLYIFPSTYVYPHQAMPVIAGKKYSLVTMLDHNPKWHYIGKSRV